ncbi:hypothetical protein BGW42_004756 [Actinomortierella wolfii]|nr:hypothetical protein BGW42_004756 [Actinomortierella wolfii]
MLKECTDPHHAHFQPYPLSPDFSPDPLSSSPSSSPEPLTLELSDLIGSGAYGTIHISFWNYQLFAIKKLYQAEKQALILREIKVNSLLRHRHIIQFLGMGVIDGSLVMITELAENDIIHRDVKSANILLTKSFEAKLCDLGHALVKSAPDILDNKSSFGGTTKALVGTIRWMAPELLGTAPEYSFKSDMYALGMVMWEMAANCTIPYQDEPNNNRVVEYVLSGGRETIPSDTPDEYRQCIERYWDQDPFKRPNASEMVPKPSIRFEYLATKGESMISDSTSSSSTKNDDDWPLPNNHQVKNTPTFAPPVKAVTNTNTLSLRTLVDNPLPHVNSPSASPLPQNKGDDISDTSPAPSF